MSYDEKIKKYEQMAVSADQVIDSYQDEADSLFDNLRESEFPYTYLALLSFAVKTESIRSAIIELAKIKELYSINILYRSYIEYFLKVVYLYGRFLDEKSDRVGEEYYCHMKGKENIALGTAVVNRGELVGSPVAFARLRSCKNLSRDFENTRSAKSTLDQVIFTIKILLNT